MPPRTLLPEGAPDSAILAVVDGWAALLEAEQYGYAFAATEHDAALGWTPELIRQVITQYGDAVAGQKVTVGGKPTDMGQRKDVRRFPVNDRGYAGDVWYDLNIDGTISDLTASFGIRAVDGGLVLVLNDIHVM